MKINKAFNNWRGGAFYLTFPNGNQLSTTFAAGSYSDNHGSFVDSTNIIDFYASWKSLEKPVESNTVEVMITQCPEPLRKRIQKKYGEPDNTVIGYLDMQQWLEIVKLLSKPNAKARTRAPHTK